MCSGTHEPVHNRRPAFLPRLRRTESGAQRNPATPSSFQNPSLCVNVAADGRSLQGLAPSSGRWHGDEAEGHQEDRGEPSEASSVDERVREKNNEEKILLIPAALSPALPILFASLLQHPGWNLRPSGLWTSSITLGVEKQPSYFFL